MFKRYKSKPITRMAIEIKIGGKLDKLEHLESTYYYSPPEGIDYIEFKAYEEPKVGDYIVRINKEVLYHVSRAVFHERNIVE